MYVYLIIEQGSFYEPKNLFTSNKKLTNKELIDSIKKYFDFKFTDLGEFRIAIGEKIYSIYPETVLDPMNIIHTIHCD